MSQSKLHVLTEIAIFSAIALVFDKLPLFYYATRWIGNP